MVASYMGSRMRATLGLFCLLLTAVCGSALAETSTQQNGNESSSQAMEQAKPKIKYVVVHYGPPGKGFDQVKRVVISSENSR